MVLERLNTSIARGREPVGQRASRCLIEHEIQSEDRQGMKRFRVKQEILKGIFTAMASSSGRFVDWQKFVLSSNG